MSLFKEALTVQIAKSVKGPRCTVCGLEETLSADDWTPTASTQILGSKPRERLPEHTHITTPPTVRADA